MSRKPGRPVRAGLTPWLVLIALLATTAATGGDRNRHDTCRPGSLPAPGLGRGHAGCDVLIVCHVGGWGDVPLESAVDLLPVVLGIKKHLQSRGLRTKTIPYNRLPASPLARLVITADIWGLHNACTRRCARRLERILRKHPDLHMLMVGLSNGAAFANSVMAQLEDRAFDRAISVECGPPAYYLPIESDRILTIIRQDEDPLSSEEADLVVANVIGILFDMVVSGVSGSPLSFEAALRESGHEYPWPEIAPEVTGFIDSWLDGQAASPAGSHPDQE